MGVLDEFQRDLRFAAELGVVLTKSNTSPNDTVDSAAAIAESNAPLVLAPTAFTNGLLSFVSKR